MAMIGKIRRMYFRDKLSVSEIARRTSLARNTIKKWLRAPRGVEPRYRRGAKPGKLTPFQAQLIQALEADAHRPKRERRTALVLKAQLAEQGAGGVEHVPGGVEGALQHLRQSAADLAQTYHQSFAFFLH
mgnify:CR=1 FL=1